MEQKWILRTGLFVLLIASLDLCSTEEIVGSNHVQSPNSSRLFDGPFKLMRKKLIRKRINDGENKETNTTNVSVSMTMSTSGGNSRSKMIFDESAPGPENTSGEGVFRRAFGKLRPGFTNRTRTLVHFPDYKPTAETRETPSTSFREFRLTMRPRLSFGKQKIRTATTMEADLLKDRPKSTATMKLFSTKNFLNEKLRRRPTTTGKPTTEDENELDYPEESMADGDDKAAVEVLSPSSSLKTTTSTTEKTGSTDAPTAPTIMTTTPVPTIEFTTTTTEKTKRSPRNSSMIIIPVPPSQRKPYHPVIMQVTKTPTTAESLPETRVVTYKLNKMFVPMGIYGKVLPKSATQADYGVTTKNTIVSTPLPFLLPGQESKANRTRINIAKDHHKGIYLRKPSPEIKVKGHRSKELEEPVTSGDNSRNFAIAYASSQMEHHEKEQKQWEIMMEKLKQKQRNLADSISLTYQQQRQSNIADISLTTEKVDVAKISLTTEESPNYDGSRRGQSTWGASVYKSGSNGMSPPRPYRIQQPTKTIFDTLTSAASSIPGLIHNGFTQLTSGYGTAFEDELRFPSPSESSNLAAVESQTQNAIPPPEDESLEYFRKRPHLLNTALNKKNRANSNFLPPEYSSGGFKPVTAPPHFASQYYASTPQHSTSKEFDSSTPTTPASETQREPLYLESKYWQPPNFAVRNAKQFLSMNDLSSWKSAVLGNSEQQQPKGFSFGSTTPRASPAIFSTQKSFADQWLEFNRKYSKYEIEDAKDKVFNMFSEARSDPYDELMYMRPPGELSKSGAGNAFDDLLKMFRLGFSFGAGHSSSRKPMLSYSAGMHAEDSYNAASGDGWKPLTKAGGSPMISFNAGLTIGGKSTSTPGYTGYGRGSHFSTSTKPFVPQSKYKNHFTSNGYSVQSFPGLSGTEVRSKYHTSTPVALRTSPTPEYGSNVYYNFKTDAVTDVSETNKQPRFEINPAVSTHFTPTISSSSDPKGFSGYEKTKLDAILGSMKYLNDQAIEIIPSSEFFRQKGNMADIAAVIKPPELSDELVKAALPPQISALPQLSYPTQQLIQNPQSFTSLSQLQQYFATTQPTPHPTPLFNHLISHQHFQPNVPQQQLFFHQGSDFFQPGVPQQFMPQLHVTQQPQANAAQLQSSKVKAAGDSALGFTEFEIPAGVDPDIASLLRAELSKDDIPEEFRKDFIEAKEQEKSKQQRHQQTSASRLRVTVVKPGQKRQQEAAKRIDKNPEIKFHKPIPIGPTMLTPGKCKPIRVSPVPKYVVELARKLKTDKDVQGIVRVSAKRNSGPPIEYLYPVRG